MIQKEINAKLSLGEIDSPGLFPHLDQLQRSKYIFEIDFGLGELPEEPGILLIRGARQYGKSTWLEHKLSETIKTFGPGSAYYLNGDNILEPNRLEHDIDQLLPAFHKQAVVKRLFIDEITAISNWEIVLKRMADAGKLSEVLVITTGSSATDIRRGAERLPGRKGRLARSNYLFTPISYQEFRRVCGDDLQSNTLLYYLISGGSPIACSELASAGTLPEFVIELARDWVDGEIARSGRRRTSLFNILNVMFRIGGTAAGQAKLAREAALSNNSVAAGYTEILNDLGCVVPAYPWDPHRKLLILRKPCKYHFTNLLAAIAYHPAKIRTPDDWLALPKTEQGIWYEWLVAQELLRRSAIRGDDILAPLAFWQNKQHEIDFVDTPDTFIEVKRGRCTPIEFSWFTQQFPGKKLTVINANAFETENIRGITLETFLLEKIK